MGLGLRGKLWRSGSSGWALGGDAWRVEQAGGEQDVHGRDAYDTCSPTSAPLPATTPTSWPPPEGSLCLVYPSPSPLFICLLKAAMALMAVPSPLQCHWLSVGHTPTPPLNHLTACVASLPTAAVTVQGSPGAGGDSDHREGQTGDEEWQP